MPRRRMTRVTRINFPQTWDKLDRDITINDVAEAYAVFSRLPLSARFLRSFSFFLSLFSFPRSLALRESRAT